MTTTDIIVLILTSSVISSLLTGLITWIVRKYDYKREYYHEIIKKRLASYDLIENFISGFVWVVGDVSTGKKYYRCLVDKDTYVHLLIKDLANAIKFSIWVDKGSQKLLHKFNDFMFNYNQYIFNDNLAEDELIEHAIQAYEVVHKLKTDLNNSILKDIQNLHHIKFKNLLE